MLDGTPDVIGKSLAQRVHTYAIALGSSAGTWRGGLRAVSGFAGSAAAIRDQVQAARAHRGATPRTFTVEDRENRRAARDPRFRRNLLASLRRRLRALQAHPYPTAEADPIAERDALCARLSSLTGKKVEALLGLYLLGKESASDVYALAKLVHAPVCERRGSWSASFAWRSSCLDEGREVVWVGSGQAVRNEWAARRAGYRKDLDVTPARHAMTLRAVLWVEGGRLRALVHQTFVELGEAAGRSPKDVTLAEVVLAVPRSRPRQWAQRS